MDTWPIDPNLPEPNRPTFVVFHSCNALCTEGRHYRLHDPVYPPAAVQVDLGDGWTELGYISEEGL